MRTCLWFRHPHHQCWLDKTTTLSLVYWLDSLRVHCVVYKMFFFFALKFPWTLILWGFLRSLMLTFHRIISRITWTRGSCYCFTVYNSAGCRYCCHVCVKVFNNLDIRRKKNPRNPHFETHFKYTYFIDSNSNRGHEW